MSVQPIFINPEHQTNFDRDGYLKITLLESSDIEKLSVLFHQYYPNPSQDFYSSSYDNNYELKKKISDAIGEILLPRLNSFFLNYSWFGSAFLSKGNGPRSEMPMHQDWTIVDETQYVAVNIWTPLQDTNEKNGTIEVIPGSHKWNNVLRAPTLPFYYNGFQSQLMTRLHAISVSAGEAVILNQAIIHYSKANKTGQTRIAITTGIKSSDAPMLFHYWDKKKPGEIEVFEQEDDFLIKFENFHQSIFLRPSIGRSIEIKKFQLPQLMHEELVRLIPGTNPPEKKEKEKPGFAQKILQWIKG